MPPTRQELKARLTAALRRRAPFPHVDEVKDPSARRTIRLLWDRVTAAEDANQAQVTATQQANAALEALRQSTAQEIERLEVATAPAADITGLLTSIPTGGGGGGGGAPPEVDDLSSTLTTLRAAYGATMTNDECVEMLNECAWIHRADSWGLNSKTSGNNGTQPTTGNKVAVDILHHQNTDVLVDCIIDAGGVSTITWNVLGVNQNPSRPWVAPVTP